MRCRRACFYCAIFSVVIAVLLICMYGVGAHSWILEQAGLLYGDEMEGDIPPETQGQVWVTMPLIDSKKPPSLFDFYFPPPLSLPSLCSYIYQKLSENGLSYHHPHTLPHHLAHKPHPHSPAPPPQPLPHRPNSPVLQTRQLFCSTSACPNAPVLLLWTS